MWCVPKPQEIGGPGPCWAVATEEKNYKITFTRAASQAAHNNVCDLCHKKLWTPVFSCLFCDAINMCEGVAQIHRLVTHIMQWIWKEPFVM